MAGLALALDLLDVSSSTGVIHSARQFTASSVAGFASFLPRSWSVVYCDAKVDAEADWHGRWVPNYGLDKYTTKTYTIELKPLLSAFRPKALATTSVRALLMNVLPLLEAYMKNEEEEQPTETPELKVVLKRSGTLAFREVSVVTVRRLLERLVVHLVSARTAWKLLKDVPKSAVRKSGRDISSLQLFAGVAKTTFRAHALGVGANWLVQEILDFYRSGKVIYIHRKNPNRAKGNRRELEVLEGLGRRTAGNTLKAASALTFAAIGAGCGAVLITPNTGTWIGLVLGDMAGAYLAAFLLDPWIYQTSS